MQCHSDARTHFHFSSNRHHSVKNFDHLPVSIEVDEDKFIVGDGGVNGGRVELDSARLREGERDQEERQHSPRLPFHGNL